MKTAIPNIAIKAIVTKYLEIANLWINACKVAVSKTKAWETDKRSLLIPSNLSIGRHGEHFGASNIKQNLTIHRKRYEGLSPLQLDFRKERPPLNAIGDLANVPKKAISNTCAKRINSRSQKDIQLGWSKL